jgi:hypothetical protein
MEATRLHNGIIVVREPQQGERREGQDQQAKLLRISVMTRQLLEEVRKASLDEQRRQRLREIYASSLQALKGALSDELQQELTTLVAGLDGVPTESEIRVAQAQLVGWLEGLFQGIQAALWTPHLQAKSQFDAIPRPVTPGETQERGSVEAGLATNQHGHAGYV